MAHSAFSAARFLRRRWIQVIILTTLVRVHNEEAGIVLLLVREEGLKPSRLGSELFCASRYFYASLGHA